MSSEGKRYWVWDEDLHPERINEQQREMAPASEVERLEYKCRQEEARANEMRDLWHEAGRRGDKAESEVERLESKVVVQETGWKAALAEVERLRTALKDEIRWNIEGTGIHPDDREGVIERHYQEALHPHEKEKS